MTHRLRRLQTEREHLLERVIASSDIERRRIAAEVHDGAVQDLIGITFSLSAAADESPPPMSDRLGGLAVATRHTVRSLRSLLNSIYPVQVPESGWAAGLDDTIACAAAAWCHGQRQRSRDPPQPGERAAAAAGRPRGACATSTRTPRPAELTSQ